MKSRVFLFLFVTLLLSNLQTVSAFSWHNLELWDLEYNDSQFITELNAWTATSLVNSATKYYNCAGTYVMGGYNVLGSVGGYKGQYWERTYTGLPAHNQLNLTYKVWAIDSWDGAGGDHYEVYVDGYVQKAWNFQWSTDGFIATCGNAGWGEFPPVLAVSTFVHSASSVTIRFINQLDQVSSDESLGIRDIKMNFVTVTTPSNSLCGRSSANKPLPSMPCVGCDTSHQFMNTSSSGTCFECATTCATCNAGGTNSCTSCSTKNYLSSGACNACSDSCITCVNSANYCTACQPGFFMASNSNCYSDCTFPLSVSESGGITYCNSPCSGSNYAMWDGSCSSTCLSELNATTMSSYPVCTFPCSINPISL